jgi:hypothetical protein
MVPVIAVHHLGDEMIEVYRALLRGATLPHLMVPGAISSDVAAALREQLDAAGCETFAIADRGHYRCNGSLRVEALWAGLADFAGRIAGAALEVRDARWLRFARGDYALVKDDSRRRPGGDHVELTLDLSTAATGEAELVYAGWPGGAAVMVPQLPSMLVLVERTAAITRYDRPVTLRAGGAEVIRLRLSLVAR